MITYSLKFVNSLILKVNNFAIFAARFSTFSLELLCLPSQICVCNKSQITEISTGEIQQNTQGI